MSSYPPDGLRLALLRFVLGLGTSAGSVRPIRSTLYETQPLDPAVFVAVSGLPLVVAGLVCYRHGGRHDLTLCKP